MTARSMLVLGKVRRTLISTPLALMRVLDSPCRGYVNTVAFIIADFTSSTASLWNARPFWLAGTCPGRHRAAVFPSQHIGGRYTRYRAYTEVSELILDQSGETTINAVGNARST